MNINKELRYKLAPQMKVYDSLGYRFLPYIMFTQPPNFRSEVLNTDERGFRFNSKVTKKSIFDEIKKNETILFLGGSAAFGVGSTKDENSITGILEKKSECNFLNLGGRAFTGFQEIISLFSNIDNLEKLNIKKIIVFSGTNDFYLNNFFDVRYPGLFYFNSIFSQKMNTFSLKKNFFIKLLEFFLTDHNKYNFNNLNKNNFLKFLISGKFRKNSLNSDFQTMALDNIIKRNFNFYRILKKIFNCDLVFIFQPILNWCKTPNNEEKSLLKYSDLYFPKQNRYVNKFLSKNHHKEFSNLLKDISALNEIKFYDMNDFFKEKNLEKEWLFVDNIHLTDDGNKHTSEYLANFI